MVTIKDGVALVTGGAGGMGEATVRLFASLGAKVMIGDIDREPGEALARQLGQVGSTVEFMHVDVTSEADVQRLVNAAVDRLGGLDFAVNCVGVDQMPTPLADTSIEDYERQLAVNARGEFLCMKHQIRAMLASGGGAIVNISSGAGLGGLPGAACYAAAKHACLGLTRTAALEYADKAIRINAVAPGTIDTPMLDRSPWLREPLAAAVPMKRQGRPAEVAEACVWLCSDSASYITGQTLGVCGGFNRVAASGVFSILTL